LRAQGQARFHGARRIEAKAVPASSSTGGAAAKADSDGELAGDQGALTLGERHEVETRSVLASPGEATDEPRLAPASHSTRANVPSAEDSHADTEKRA
jgi:hypothetical protein